MASYRCLDTNCNGRGILKCNHKITNKDNQDLEFYNFNFLEKKYDNLKEEDHNYNRNLIVKNDLISNNKDIIKPKLFNSKYLYKFLIEFITLNFNLGYNRFQIKEFFIKKYGEIKLIMNYYLTKKLII